MSDSKVAELALEKQASCIAELGQQLVKAEKTSSFSIRPVVFSMCRCLFVFLQSQFALNAVITRNAAIVEGQTVSQISAKLNSKN